MTIDEIKNIMKNKQAIYDLKVDQRMSKIGSAGGKLIKYPMEKLPNYIQKNKDFYKEWLDEHE